MGDALHERRLDALSLPGALAREQRQGCSLHGEHAAYDVGDRHAEPVGRTIGGSGDAHQTAFCLDDRIVAGFLAPWAGLAES